MSDGAPPHADPPEASPAARRAARRLLAPVERFLSIEAASGVLLLVVAACALALANSPARGLYEALWHTPIGLRVGPWAFERDLHFWINDGLMTVFFFVVGLEIRREIHGGELSEVRRAALPLAAAVGGMIAPALIFFAFNVGRPSVVGWGVPMATDIAFAVGVLALLGSRVPPALRILLLALAVIDDVGAIVVIAVFYSSGLSLVGFGIVLAGIALILAMQKLGVRSRRAYVPAGVLIWAGAYKAGVHPTLAGVIVGLLTPVRAWYGREGFVDVVARGLQELRGSDRAHVPLPALDEVHTAHREATSPAEMLLHGLHAPVAYLVMPLFALANAGVPVGGAALGGDGFSTFVGVVAGLAIGKPVGVLGLSWLAGRAGLVALPRGVRWADVLVVGAVAGIGFTMALFVAQLAFPSGELLQTAKLAVLCASAVAGVGGLVLGRVLLRREARPDAAKTAAEAETSSVV